MRIPLTIALLSLLTFAWTLPAAGASDICDVEQCVENVKDYVLSCGLLPLYDVALCWFAEGGVWYDFVVNGVVVELVGCNVVGGPACRDPMCQTVSPEWPNYCPPE